MWIYEKKLEFPVHIKEPNPKLAQLIISQYVFFFIAPVQLMLSLGQKQRSYLYECTRKNNEQHYNVHEHSP